MATAGTARAPYHDPVTTEASFPPEKFPLPDLQLLSLCISPGKAESVSPRNWDALINAAARHGIAALLHIRIPAHVIPEPARRRLSQIYRANVARNLRLSRETHSVCQELLRHGIRPVVLKGPALAERLCADIGARQVADMDLLIRPADLPAADALLHRLGYLRALAGPIANFSGCRDALYLSAGQPATFLDLHMRLRPYGASDRLAELIWSQGMTPENLLLYLCLNLLTHRAARLQPLTDLIAFLAKESAALDWPLVVKLVQSLEWPHGAFWALRCAEELQSGLVPPAALRALKPDRFSAGWIESFFGPGAEYVIRSGSRLTGPRGTLALVGCEKGFTGRARLLAAMLFPPAATLRQMEPGQQDQSTIVHYFARIARAAGQLLPSGNRNSG